MNAYPRWKYVLLTLLTVLGVIYALPNIFLEDPAVEISPNLKNISISEITLNQFNRQLAQQGIEAKKTDIQQDRVILRFNNTDEQIKARDILNNYISSLRIQDQEPYTVALNLAASTPAWLNAFGAKPLKLGLDLRGGIHFLLEVDIPSVIQRRTDALAKSMLRDLREAKIRYQTFHIDKTEMINFTFANDAIVDRAKSLIQRRYNEVVIDKRERNLFISYTPAALNDIRQYTIDQTMTTLQNRVNELGVAEAVVQQQGSNRVAVDLPGVQDATRARQILGGTATLAFYLVDTVNDPRAAKLSGVPPFGSHLYDYEGTPILLKNQLVLSGDAIVSATSATDENGMPAVHITIGGGNEGYFARVTRDNIGKPLAIVYIETKTDLRMVNGKQTKVVHKFERVISAPRINSALGSNFQITGLDAKEATDLALLLRAGSLPAAINIVEESTIGPSLGMENIKRGLESLVAGMLLVIIFMAMYYRTFGLIANIALILDLIFLTAILSLIGATLTLPGIAGIVLTVGMAVDSNVLIFERIREELRSGAGVQSSIYAGYERAFATILDANITTLIVGLILFGIGSGAIRGFAVTLTIGILTSMLTAITFTRAIVNIMYGKRHLKHLPIGIKL